MVDWKKLQSDRWQDITIPEDDSAVGPQQSDMALKDIFKPTQPTESPQLPTKRNWGIDPYANVA